MLQKSIGISFVLLLLTVLVLPGSSHAIPFEGNAWLANHNGTSEYFVLLEGPVAIDPNKVKMKGFKFKSSTPTADFRQLTSTPVAFEIDNGLSKKLRKWTKKAPKKGFTPEEFIEAKLASKVFKVKFKDLDGNKYKGKLSFAGFNNPFELDEGTPPSNSIPEPATMLLLGAGLLGMAGIRRIRKR
jgi:hypothetical protein